MTCLPCASVVGSLMCEMVYTRPNNSHAMGVLSRYTSTPRKEHWTIVKRMLMYFCDTTKYEICYQGKPETDMEVNVHGFVDVDYVGDLDRRSLTNGYVFRMFYGETNWMSKR
jgi:hypothetical protein